ncbi:MAG: hypothetical protein EXQ92_07810 [Alphaproteobacteria bacterium]|nr:hypothetical protein [Alphaproteobacteria bacterium]
MTAAERPRPEQTFFNDPALDRAFGVVMTLASEVYVLRDRQRALERVLEAKGVAVTAELDGYQPSAEERQQIEADRDAFVRHLLENLLGEQKSRGPL